MDADAARAYQETTAEDRDRLRALWTVLMREYRANPVSLAEMMDRIGAKARKRGLTPRKLDSILNARQ
jgi:hypothetical protein